MPEHLPADLLAALLGVSPRTVRRWARADGWATVGRWPHLRYRLEDVDATMRTRRGVTIL